MEENQSFLKKEECCLKRSGKVKGKDRFVSDLDWKG